MEFVVPDSPFDLELPRAAGRVRVHRVIDVEAVADVDALVSTLSDRLLGGGGGGGGGSGEADAIFAAVLEPDVFDALYSLVKCVSTEPSCALAAAPCQRKAAGRPLCSVCLAFRLRR